MALKNPATPQIYQYMAWVNARCWLEGVAIQQASISFGKSDALFLEDFRSLRHFPYDHPRISSIDYHLSLHAPLLESTPFLENYLKLPSKHPLPLVVILILSGSWSHPSSED
ncbi:hypothetical protein DSO57_1031769 [Entomophthora muscae]|uniref:Uncharacterized protein n=1 Tax=Entomophthora muscae TaxID=34485 RepID=A0ACC2RFD7_9FUNG|nr:hypothetical protein DSO57_1031769 [Entomophthora muscae]